MGAAVKINLTLGQMVGRLRIIEECRIPKGYHLTCRGYVCACVCGRRCAVRVSDLRSSRQISCGCARTERIGKLNFTHGASVGRKKSRLLSIWRDMNRRCADQRLPAWPYYGGRGISVCAAWQQSFEDFRSWALENGYSAELTLDRRDTLAGYSPGNCRWVPRLVQARNRRLNAASTTG